MYIYLVGCFDVEVVDPPQGRDMVGCFVCLLGWVFLCGGGRSTSGRRCTYLPGWEF